MKDYSFGNRICALRTGLGLSQFQLGTLVGVTDKAVSKWENASARPRFATCLRLAEVLGVPIDELLSCKQPAVSLARKELDKMNRELWKRAYERLLIYGDPPPAVCWSRLAAEEAALCGTDAIQSFAVMGEIRAAARENGSVAFPVNMPTSSFAAWLLGASDVNPLPPHYRCPECGKTEFVSAVSDGFDLPDKRCGCGAEFLRDGHDIPFEGYVKEGNRQTFADIRVSEKFKPTAARIIKTYYEGKAEIVPVRLMWGGRPSCIEKYVVWDTRKPKPPLSDDGIWYVEPEKFRRRLDGEMQFSMSSTALTNRIQILWDRTDVEIPDPLSLISPEMAERLYQRMIERPAHISSVTELVEENEPHDFGLLYKTDGVHYAIGAWCTRDWSGEVRNVNGELLVREGRVDIRDLPVFREDVWNDVSAALARNGIRDNGLAVQIMEDVRLGRYYHEGMPEGMGKTLLSLGLPKWYPGFLENVEYMISKGHYISLLLMDMILEWYRQNCPEEYDRVMNRDEIDQE